MRSLRDNLFKCLLTAILAGCFVLAFGSADSLYRAGMMNGRYLYWVPINGLQLDTVNFDYACTEGTGVSIGKGKKPGEVISDFSAKGLQLLRMVKPTAISVAILQARDYPVLVLTQWHSAPNGKVLVPKPGMIQEALRHTILSDYMWTFIKRADVEDLGAGMADRKIRLSFDNAGFSYYAGREIITENSQEILGAQGLSIRVPESNFHEDLNVQRKVFSVYIAAAKDKKISDIVGDIEKGMDRLKLDMSYQVPEMKPVR